MNPPEIPDSCPQCGADFLRDTDGPIQFHCGSVSKRGYIGLKIETAICTGRQRDQLAEKLRVLKHAGNDMARTCSSRVAVQNWEKLTAEIGKVGE